MAQSEARSEREDSEHQNRADLNAKVDHLEAATMPQSATSQIILLLRSSRVGCAPWSKMATYYRAFE